MSEPQQLTPAQGYQQFVDRMTTQVIAAMPLSVPDGDLKRARARFRVAFSADAQAALQECTSESVARAIVLSAMSGLFPGGPRPDVWLIPRRNKHRGNVLEANWQLSARGCIRLARRALWDVEPVLVFAGEKFEIVEGDAPSITHVRNLDLPQTWESLRGAYARVFPEGGRLDPARRKFVYLSKEQIEKRRKKAQDDSIWREWPLEMALKTICAYAGARETFPTDDPARYALDADNQAEIGGGGTSAEAWGALPAGSKTAGLAARLAAKPEGPVIEVAEGRPLATVDLEEEQDGSVQASQAGPHPFLTPEHIAALVELCGNAPPVSEEDVAAILNPSGGPDDPPASRLAHVIGHPGETEAQLFQRARAAVRDAKKAAQKGAP